MPINTFQWLFCSGNYDINNPYMAGTACSNCSSTCSNNLCGKLERLIDCPVFYAVTAIFQSGSC